MNSLVIDTKPLERKVKKAKKTMSEKLLTDAKLAGKRTAWFMSLYTLPKSRGDSDWPMNKLNDRIRSDVEKAYVTKEDEGWQWKGYELIEDGYGEEKAKDFWRLHKEKGQSVFDDEDPSGGFDAERAFDKMRKVKRSIDPTGYAAKRKSEGVLTLPANTRPMGMVQPQRREKFIKQRQATAGLAKTGWYAVSRVIGGQQNYTKAKGAVGRVIWPKPMRKIFNKFGGVSLGRADFAINATSYAFSITNNVRYADEALPSNLYEIALDRSKRAMQHIMAQRFKRKGWDFR